MRVHRPARGEPDAGEGRRGRRRSTRTIGQRLCLRADKFTEDAVYMRNNRRPDAGTAVVDHAEWAVFAASVKDGDYDL
ncbi:MAG: hypothetical protein DLM60_23130 [Pseudonocardiales bacterium]|nr:MAG: hypothetical protein DLM60_23130 [Pseudonocardiales bacterium]